MDNKETREDWESVYRGSCKSMVRVRGYGRIMEREKMEGEKGVVVSSALCTPYEVKAVTTAGARAVAGAGAGAPSPNNNTFRRTSYRTKYE